MLNFTSENYNYFKALKEKIAIFGAGDFGREVLVLIRQINDAGGNYEFIGFFDDSKSGNFYDYPILGGINELNALNENLNLVISVADTAARATIAAKIQNTLITFPVLIHPDIRIQPFQQILIGKGSIICAGNLFTCNITLGDFVIINLACTIGHDVELGDFCSIMPGVNISGKVTLGRGVYVGTGAKLINYLEIGDSTTIAAGAVVVGSFENNLLISGVPARIVKKELL